MKKQVLKDQQWYPEVFNANLTALQENVWHLMMSAICGQSYSGCIAKLEQDGSWQKMYQGCYQVKMDGFFGRVLRDLAERGCYVWWYCFPAHAAGTTFWGERVAIVAASNCIGWIGLDSLKKNKPSFDHCGCLADAQARQIYLRLHVARSQRSASGGAERNDDGIPEALDELKAYGNAVVPQQFYPIFQAIADVERMME